MLTLNTDDAELQQMLAKRLETVDNEPWYIELLGLALEEADDTAEAFRIADGLYERQPYPPPSEQDEEDRKISDALAIDEYAQDAKLMPDELPFAVAAPVPPAAVPAVVNVAAPVANVPPPIVNVTVPPAHVEVNVPKQPVPQVTVNVPQAPTKKVAHKNEDGRWIVQDAPEGGK